MPISPEQLDNWFTYHAPTDETAPKYAAIRAAEVACHRLCDSLTMSEYTATAEDYAKVNATTRAFVEAIDANAPDSADKTAAIRCVRLAQNALNEHIASSIHGFPAHGFPAHANLLFEASRQLALARWQANSAIACGGR